MNKEKIYVVHKSGLVVCDDGSIFGSNGNQRKTRMDRNGYLRLNHYYKGKHTTFKVHTIVAECFIGEIGNKTVNHINGDKTDNSYSNLEIISSSDNTKKAFRNGLVGTCLPALGYYSRREAERNTGISRKKMGGLT